MKRWHGEAVLSWLLLLTSAAQSASAAANPPKRGYTQDTTNQTGAAFLRNILTRVGMVDGKPITDFQMKTRCVRTVASTTDTFLIDWRGVGNYAGHFEGGRESFAINDGKSVHVISVPAGVRPEPLGNAGARVDSGFGVIADSCGH